jgi:hypothetical protein
MDTMPSTRARRLLPLLVILGVCAALEAPPVLGGDSRLAAVLARELPRAEAAGNAAFNGRGTPEAIQAQYDAARDLQQALEEAEPVSRGCAQMVAAARELALGEIMQAEGVDRPSRPLLDAGIARVAATERTLARLPRQCSAGPIAQLPPIVAELDAPRSGEMFTGGLSVHAPASATRAEILVDGRISRSVAVGAPTLRVALSAPPGRYDLDVRFLDGAVTVGRRSSHGVWLLPRSALKARRVGSDDRALAAGLAALANSFSGYSAIWVQNLANGTSASWNADARFPAASTVKLAVLIASLRRDGPQPERSAAWYDMQTLAGWSSNLAANRLLVELGDGSEQRGTDIANAVLQRLGATSSTYTGEYRVGTSCAAAPNQPPLVSGRVTTARDLGRILYTLDAAAMGDRQALQQTQLTRHEASVGIGLLLNSEPRADNLGLFRPWLPGSLPVAQKNGWLDDARHTAAVLFTPDGPRIVVLLTYRVGITRPQAAQLGRRVLKLALAH